MRRCAHFPRSWRQLQDAGHHLAADRRHPVRGRSRHVGHGDRLHEVNDTPHVSPWYTAIAVMAATFMVVLVTAWANGWIPWITGTTFGQRSTGWLGQGTDALIFGIIMLSLVPLIGWAGQVNFANFAIGLCEGEIAEVRRVWADGKELDLGKMTLRVHRGDETQAADPLIVAKEGADRALAYRGLAYVVFERLALAVWPSLFAYQYVFELKPAPDLQAVAVQ